MSEATNAAIQAIFDFWQSEMQKPLAKLTPGRRAKIAARLKSFSVDDIKRAIRGCRSSAFHMGRNEANTEYNSIDLICRNDSKIEFFLDIKPAAKKAPILHKLTDRSWADDDAVPVKMVVGEVVDMFRE